MTIEDNRRQQMTIGDKTQQVGLTIRENSKQKQTKTGNEKYGLVSLLATNPRLKNKFVA